MIIAQNPAAENENQLTLQLRNESYVQIVPKVGPRQLEILKLLADNPKTGATAWEIAEVSGRMIHTVRPRLTELCIMGIIQESGSRWYEKTQRNETIWKLVDNQT